MRDKMRKKKFPILKEELRSLNKKPRTLRNLRSIIKALMKFRYKTFKTSLKREMIAIEN